MATTSNLKPFKKGNPGRPKGSLNKFTTLKAAFLEAFERTGGADGLVEWVRKRARNREVFYQMVTKLFPQEVAHGGPDGGLPEFVLKVIHTDGGGNGKGNGNGGGDGDGGK